MGENRKKKWFSLQTLRFKIGSVYKIGLVYKPWIGVFSRAGQLSEVNVDPDVLTDMVSIIVNKHTYDPSLHHIMKTYYEMFRGKNQANKKDLFNSPDIPDHSDQDSDAHGWTRLRTSRGVSAEWVVCERETSLIYNLLRLHSLSFIKINRRY